ncbi:hypothetical protein WJX81_005037 [Elliptochloris bilobata]|uniref:F-box/LRR-repeat protein 15-like leucin rich repeat domain-containing protein n=1 Tax=Elliptochloris bilobata TaxID=381761 RepID=A0AAW1S6Y3_9CHLO
MQRETQGEKQQWRWRIGVAQGARSLQAGTDATDAALAAALAPGRGGFTCLMALNLCDCRQITLAGAGADGALRGLERTLTSLRLAGCYRVDDGALGAVLPALPKLARLDLDHCWRLTDGALAVQLGGLRALRRLSLAGCFRLGGGVLAAAARLPRLRWLDAAACDVNDAAVQALAHQSASLESLDLSYCSRVGDAGAGALQCLSALRRLDLTWTAVTPACIPFEFSLAAASTQTLKVGSWEDSLAA